MAADSVRRVFLNNNTSDSPNTPLVTSTPGPTTAQEISQLRELLETARQERDEAVREANQLNALQSSYIQSLGTVRRESMIKYNQINRLNEQLRETNRALHQAREDLNTQNAYRTSAQRIIESFHNDNDRLKREIVDLKAQLHSASIQKSGSIQSTLIKTEPKNDITAIFRYGVRILPFTFA